MINRASIWLALMMTLAIWAILVSPTVPSVPSLLPISQLLACFVVSVVVLSTAKRLPQVTATVDGPLQSHPPLAVFVSCALSFPLRR